MDYIPNRVFKTLKKKKVTTLIKYSECLAKYHLSRVYFEDKHSNSSYNTVEKLKDHIWSMCHNNKAKDGKF